MNLMTRLLLLKKVLGSYTPRGEGSLHRLRGHGGSELLDENGP